VPAAALTRRLYEAYQARDWDTATGCLHPEAVLDMPVTREKLTGRDDVMAFQRSYPEPWGTLTVLDVVDGGGRAVAEIRVDAPDGTFWLMAFWQERDGLLHRGVEYWATEEDPPSSRATADS
jgi:ketosteroid isomerase-like protein